jgi:hypothetical protein
VDSTQQSVTVNTSEETKTLYRRRQAVATLPDITQKID